MYFEEYDGYTYTISWYPPNPPSFLLFVFDLDDELIHTNFCTDPINARAEARGFISYHETHGL